MDPPGVFLLAYANVALGRDGARCVRRTALASEARRAGSSTRLVFATSIDGVPSRIVLQQCGAHVTRVADGARACELPRSVSGDCEILHGILLGTDCDALFDRVLVKAFDLLEPSS